jgi:hypothetical protein
MALKHVAFAPASQKQLGSRLRSSLLSSRNHACSASLTVFLPYSLRQAREPDGGGCRVCLNEVSYAGAGMDGEGTA